VLAPAYQRLGADDTGDPDGASGSGGSSEPA
jgi:hypothetical protein